MATMFITEYMGAGIGTSGPVQVAIEPRVASQTVVIGGVLSSAPFNTATRMVRLHVDGICSFTIGAATSPVATTVMSRMVAGQTEYFMVTPGHRVSVIANT